MNNYVPFGRISLLLGLTSLLLACGVEAPRGLERPEVLSAEAAPGIRTVSLKAVLDKSDNVSTCGFHLWDAQGQESSEAIVSPSLELSAEVSGLKPEACPVC